MSHPMDHSDRRAIVAEHWHKWQTSIRAYLVAAVSDYHDAEDLLQQVAVAVARDYEKYDPETPFVRWAIAIARNRVLNYRRSKAMNKLVFSQDTLDLLESVMPAEPPAEAETKAALDDCINKLQSRSQQALKLRYEQDLRSADVAEQLGMTVTAVTTLMSRVHKALAKCIKQATGVAS
ncbi:MAG: sigma-70 family RNA polymerase sigma factor [Planctomycetota bacterium]